MSMLAHDLRVMADRLAAEDWRGKTASYENIMRAAAAALEGTPSQQLEWIWENCKVVYFPPLSNGTAPYPVEHNPAANKNSRAFIDQYMRLDLED